jgi:sugar phosphate isomerase/epimerase
MKIGVFIAIFAQESFEKALDKAKALDLETVEIGTGNYPGNSHCQLDALLKSEDKRKQWLDAVQSRGLEISGLSCHGNMLHPDATVAKAHHQVFEKTIRLAELLGISVVNNFSGTPGGGPQDLTPNWITCPWPNEYTDALKWQWEKKLIPYWKKMSKFMADHGVKVGLEMHPGFMIYNPEGLLRLRQECGDNIGCNFDPSHLFWQGIDPVVAVRALTGCIYHSHAKDTKINETNCKVNGVLDTKSYLDEINRSWIFRSVGYGHGREFWCDLVSTMRLCGYNGSLSIEHEDSLMSGSEGLNKAIQMLKDVVIREDLGKAWWV